MSPSIGPVNTFATAPTGDSQPDSLTQVGNTIFAEYGNGADSTGGGGSSQLVQYSQSGKVLTTYDIAGSVDGLKYNPANGLLYALQNQDGNSTLTLIDPQTHQVSQPYSYATTSATRGRDDVAFDKGETFLSYTNPDQNGGPNQTVIQELTGVSSSGKLETIPALRFGATGTNTVTGQHDQPVPLNDPDSLKTAPNGDLLLSSGDDGVIVDVKHPGQDNQSVKFTQVTDANGVAASGLDDVIKPGATSGNFTLTDTNGNDILSFHASHLNPNDYYASVSSLGGFGQIDPKTGVFKLLVPASGAHGLVFQPTGQGGGSGNDFVYSDGAGTSAGTSAEQQGNALSHQSAALAQAIFDGGSSGGTTGTVSTVNEPGAGSIASPELKTPHQHFHFG